VFKVMGRGMKAQCQCTLCRDCNQRRAYLGRYHVPWWPAAIKQCASYLCYCPSDRVLYHTTVNLKEKWQTTSRALKTFTGVSPLKPGMHNIASNSMAQGLPSRADCYPTGQEILCVYDIRR